MQLRASLSTLKNIMATNIATSTIRLVEYTKKFSSSGFYAVAFNKKNPIIAGIPQIKTIPTTLIRVLIISMRKKRGKLSKINESVDFALSI
jgi:hypothetical protein